jgi:hypothetical protein
MQVLQVGQEEECWAEVLVFLLESVEYPVVLQVNLELGLG